jgi:hypothetical protein
MSSLGESLPYLRAVAMLLPTVASACAPRDHVAAAVAALAALTREVQVFEVAAPPAAAAGVKGGKAGVQRQKDFKLLNSGSV